MINPIWALVSLIVVIIFLKWLIYFTEKEKPKPREPEEVEGIYCECGSNLFYVFGCYSGGAELQCVECGKTYQTLIKNGEEYYIKTED